MMDDEEMIPRFGIPRSKVHNILHHGSHQPFDVPSNEKSWLLIRVGLILFVLPAFVFLLYLYFADPFG
ncbi:hypothetical protein KQX54_006048 [Cotesia glomerata]|uniref:Uncharacterized protein n=1 Tax=Cotesia glomerata TaxID=32391 RepID=A0AAV7J738_COTGL|nr:hypothetical protein KQX54_006048 [Cotesia glomerata]